MKHGTSLTRTKCQKSRPQSDSNPSPVPKDFGRPGWYGQTSGTWVKSALVVSSRHQKPVRSTRHVRWFFLPHGWLRSCPHSRQPIAFHGLTHRHWCQSFPHRYVHALAWFHRSRVRDWEMDKNSYYWYCVWVKEWVREWMSEWVGGCPDVWLGSVRYGWVSEYVSQSFNAWVLVEFLKGI